MTFGSAENYPIVEQRRNSILATTRVQKRERERERGGVHKVCAPFIERSENFALTEVEIVEDCFEDSLRLSDSLTSTPKEYPDF